MKLRVIFTGLMALVAGGVCADLVGMERNGNVSIQDLTPMFAEPPCDCP